MTAALGRQSSSEMVMHQSGSQRLTIVFFLLASACSGAQDDAEVALGGADAEQGIGEDACATIPANESHTGDFVYTSPRLYGDNHCRNAVIVDDRSAVRQPTKVVQWADAVPTTESACKLAFVTSSFYVRGLDGAFMISGKPRSDKGDWHATLRTCTVPIVTWHDKADLNYRIVASAQMPSGGVPTRIVRIRASR
jgi:hypothetical protein